MKIVKHLTVQEGASFTEQFSYVDGSGNAIDITGATAKLLLASDFDGFTALFLDSSVASGSGSFAIDGPAGTVGITITPDGTASIADCRWPWIDRLPAARRMQDRSLMLFYQITLTLADDTVIRLAEGDVELQRSLSQ